MPQYYSQILELLESNGWTGLFEVEILNKEHNDAEQTVRIRLGLKHLTNPGDIVNDYCESRHPLEQIQQDCLRALRTGRTGI
jgi:hypothetical protein